MARTRRKRQKYSEEQRITILAAARKEGLTAAQVKKKFGVTPVTYYSWRKKTGIAGRRGRANVLVAGRRGDLNGQVRYEVQSKIRNILPAIVRSEVSDYLNEIFGSRRGRRAHI
jgi:transposase-like protein